MDTVAVSGLPADRFAVASTKSPDSELDAGMDDLTFDCPEDEAAFYREKCRDLTALLEETRAELDEFQASSKELEAELEQELLSTEKKHEQLEERIKRLEMEKDEWRTKHVALQKMHSSSTSAMQREMDNLRSERDKTLIALRELEMGNDELERNERVAASSLLDLESKFNRSIEEKTLLEQELIAKQELDEECQRLKDELRDANEEISILRDQAARVLPTPPSSVSLQPSPKRDPMEINLSPDPAGEGSTPSPPRHSVQVQPRPSPSPLLRRTTIGSPGGLSRISQSPSVSKSNRTGVYTSHLGTVDSPRLNRTQSARPSAAAVPADSGNLAAKREANKLLHKMQMRLESTSAKLVEMMPKRNVSQPGPVGAGRRTTSIGFPDQHNQLAPQDSRQLPPQDVSTPVGDRSASNVLSPNGWIMVSDGEETPTNVGGIRNAQAMGLSISRSSPDSPRPAAFRAVSSASTSSSRGLPTRPAIPSPLTTNPAKSTSRIPAPKASPLTRSTATPSRFTDHRPLSPSMLPQPARSLTFSTTLSQSTARALNTSTSRPPSRQATDRAGAKSQHTALGRGPPPTTVTLPAQQALRASMSGSQPMLQKRTPRRSSLGVVEAGLPGTGIPAPRLSPGRPISMPIAHTTPPPVPRIPSTHVRESARRQAVLGHSRIPRER